MRLWLRLVLLTAVTCACGGTRARIESRALGGEVSASPDRFIIAAVDNTSAPFLARAGSTPRGYDAIAIYGPTSRARHELAQVALDYGLHEVNAWPIEPLKLHCAVLRIPDGVDRASLLIRLEHDKRVKLAQPLQSFSTKTADYNDPYVSLQQGFQQMDVANAHVWSTGEGVVVAIIDTGADTLHPDLRGRIVAAANFVDADANRFREDRHGTEMAGVIAAVANNREGIVGVAPRSGLLVFKACWQLRPDADAASCNSFTLARALVAAYDAHAQVVNLSIAGPRDPLLNELIGEGVRRGVLFVGAASNLLGDAEGSQSREGVLSVVSAGSHAAPSSLQAPGREILTLLPDGHYDFASGDSIATAQVSGVVALLLAKDRSLSAEAVRKLLRETSSRSGSLTEGVQRVDACAAMVTLVRRGSCTPINAAGRTTYDRGPHADTLTIRN